MAEPTKGKLEYIGMTGLVACGERRITIAGVQVQGVDLDTNIVERLPAEANAAEFVRRWNAFEKDGPVDALLAACEALLRAVIWTGSRVQEEQAAIELGEAAIAKAKEAEK